jgi:hypothetical protein
MKSKYIISTFFLSSFLMTNCVDLNYSEVTTDDEKWVYESPINGVQKLVTDIYAQIPYDFGRYDGAMESSTTDESDYALSLSDIHEFYNGGWSAVNPFSFTWNNSYAAIAESNLFLEKMDRISLAEYVNNGPEYDVLRTKFEKFPYEVRFLRAYFYFELAKTYGDVPLVTHSLTNAEANSVTRTPVQEVFKYIIDECDAIADFLPVTYETELSQETGRASRPMALALKARTLLYAASPLFNPNNDKELWRKAAEANKQVIDKCQEWGIRLDKYNELWGDRAYWSPEMIFIRPAGATDDDTGWGNRFEKYNYPVGVENGNSGNCPTQSLVDSYEYQATGKTFGETWGNTVNLTTENPYEGLDPRFGFTVVKNGDRWPTYNAYDIETFEGGRNASPLYGSTTTGYYLRKYCDPDVNISTNNMNTRRHSWVIYRLGEFYLNYAEAIYHYLGDAEAKGEFGLSANEAINMLRSRSDIQMPPFQGNANFAEKYMRERMVELAFEGHRFWDVRRWKKGADFFRTIQTVKLTKDSNANIILERGSKSRIWDDKYNLFPIPFTERQKNPALTQNPGWE